MRNTAIVVAILFAWIGLSDVVVGQTVLQRLQNQIRDRVQAGQNAENAKDSAVPTIANPRKVKKADVSADVKVGYLGVVVDDKKDRGRGVRVLKVIPGGPAEKAGFKANDLITSIARVQIRSVGDMAGILDQIPPNTMILFTVLRNGQRKDLNVTFGRRVEPLVVEQIKRPVPIEIDNRTTKTKQPKLPKQDEVDQARIELLEQRLDRLEKRFDELERSLLKWLKKS